MEIVYPQQTYKRAHQNDMHWQFTNKLNNSFNKSYKTQKRASEWPPREDRELDLTIQIMLPYPAFAQQKVQA